MDSATDRHVSAEEKNFGLRIVDCGKIGSASSNDCRALSLSSNWFFD
jgi:hypothetical protein